MSWTSAVRDRSSASIGIPGGGYRRRRLAPGAGLGAPPDRRLCGGRLPPLSCRPMERTARAGQHHLAIAADRTFERFGDREALYFEGTWLRSGDLQDRSLRLAGGLARLGVRPGDRV